MSIASEQLLKEVNAKVHQLEAMVQAMKMKLDAMEALVIPRPKRIPRENNVDTAKDSPWVQPTTRS